MNINNATPSSVSTQVWAALARTLTSLIGPITVAGGSNGSLAASSSLAFTPAVGTLTSLQLSAKAGAAGSTTFNVSDGTNVYILQTVAAGQTGVSTVMLATTNAIPRITNNDAANATLYAYSSYNIA